MATVGNSIQRFVAQPWAVWTFIIAGSLLTTLCGAALAAILLQYRPMPKRYGIPEFDVFSEPAIQLGTLRQKVPAASETKEVMLGQFLQELSFSERPSLLRLAKVLEGKRIISRLAGSRGNGTRILIIRDSLPAMEKDETRSQQGVNKVSQKADTADSTASTVAAERIAGVYGSDAIKKDDAICLAEYEAAAIQGRNRALGSDAASGSQTTPDRSEG
ncbi:hypothetical protein QBC47DRAFT_364576 [Echria macrotheca]|uniref:Uncharacterized protein n=1 Tax=Echria macrotheca TaxID=438768 RepID=A0AAJ0F7B6_9PEZI|nr:hypothetical protein QBC47DRAFT_364576 [Echria macrotheca]